MTCTLRSLVALEGKKILEIHTSLFESETKRRRLTQAQVDALLISHKGEWVKIDETDPAWTGQPKRLGDWIASALAAVGITPARVEQVVGKKCGCNKRKRKLNELHDKAANLWSSINGKQVDDK